MAKMVAEVKVSGRQRLVLEGLAADAASIPARLMLRAEIVLMSAEKVDDAEHASELGVDSQRVRRWRERWSAAEEQLAAAEGDELSDLVREVLDNAPRPDLIREKAEPVTLSERQRAILERWVGHAASTPHRLVVRSRIVLMSADGETNAAQGRRLDVDRQLVRRWRGRWASNEEHLAAAERENVGDKDLAVMMSKVLDDALRPGSPGKFSAEELTQIISVACESPQDCERPVTHWTPRELSDEVIKRGIVESISPRHLDRFLKKGAFGRTGPGTG